jgi:hypothetical protein
MIADSYLQLRSELEAAVTGLLKLAGELRRTAPWLDMLQGFVTEIRQPLVLIVIGESKTGKSSLLNALSGTDFITEAESDRVCIFQHGREPKSVDVTPRLRQLYLPAAFLRDLKIIDTPGLEKTTAQDRQTIREFVVHADLVLVVFSLRNPWSPATWEFVTSEKLPLKNFVFTLQQADLREPKEVAIIRRNFEDDAKQKLGFSPPLFAISARTATIARPIRSPDELVEHQGDFAALKEQIDLVITQSGGRTQRLRSACQLAQLVLHDIGSELRASVDALAHDERRLKQAEAVRQMARTENSRWINDALVGFEAVGRDEIRGVIATLEQKLSLTNLVSFHSRAGMRLQHCAIGLEAKLRASVEQELQKIVDGLETELRGVWPQVHDTIDQQLVTDAKQKIPQAGPDAPEHKRDLVDRLLPLVSQHLTGISRIEAVSRFFACSRACLIVSVLSAFIAALTTKVSLRVAIALAFVAICAGFAAGAFVWASRKKISQGCRKAQQTELPQLQQIVRKQVFHTIDTFHDAIREKLQPLVAHCEGERSSTEPALRRTEELQRTLGGLSLRLR